MPSDDSSSEPAYCDHSTCGWKPREEEPSTKSDFLRCRCDHFQMNHRPVTKGGCRNCACDGFKLRPEEVEEPPMTPEEEEQAPADWHCMHKNGCPRLLEGVCLHGCRDAADELAREANEMEPPPPQPERRPPYAVAYSVQGHLYEVALPGDATVKAVDGALIIQHHLGPVAGIVQVLPISNERSADGAE